MTDDDFDYLDYPEGAVHDAEHPDHREFVLTAYVEQNRQLFGKKNLVKCPCDKEIRLQDGYRCLYCEVIFCTECAIGHFGTLEEFVESRNGFDDPKLRVKVSDDA